jgi:hypothetical protein
MFGSPFAANVLRAERRLDLRRACRSALLALGEPSAIAQHRSTHDG